MRRRSTLATAQLRLAYLGHGHTDNDIVIEVPDAGVLFAGDLLENDAAPSYGDAYPRAWAVHGERAAAAAGAGTQWFPVMEASGIGRSSPRRRRTWPPWPSWARGWLLASSTRRTPSAGHRSPRELRAPPSRAPCLELAAGE